MKWSRIDKSSASRARETVLCIKETKHFWLNKRVWSFFFNLELPGFDCVFAEGYRRLDGILVAGCIASD